VETRKKYALGYKAQGYYVVCMPVRSKKRKALLAQVDPHPVGRETSGEQ
jgi:hypothetical protein